jgi:prepilin-type N-terminal cleavage/methylation domain-containing protein
MRNRFGFTMFELLMVLAVLAVMVGAALPSIQTWILRAKIDHAGTALIQLASEAKRRAVESGETWAIRYVPGQACLQISSCQDSSSILKKSDRGATNQRNLHEALTMEFLDSSSRSRIDCIQVSPVGAISPVEVQIFNRDSLVDAFVSDRLTGDIRRKSKARQSN